MTHEEQAMFILEKLNNKVNVNWNLLGVYMPPIIEALKEIDKRKEAGHEV